MRRGYIEYGICLQAAQGAGWSEGSISQKQGAGGENAAGFFCAKNGLKKVG